MIPAMDILVISFSNLATDARVRRQIGALCDRYTVGTAALGPDGREGKLHWTLPWEDHHLRLPPLLRKMVSAGMHARRYITRHVLRDPDAAYWEGHRRAAWRKIRHLRPALIIANDLDALPLAIRLADGHAKVVFDAHEFSPRQHENDPEWVREHQPVWKYLCKRYMPLADACFTVSEGIAEAYLELTGIRPEVLTNAVPYEELAPVITDPRRIKLVHHGMASPQRRIAELVEMMDALRDTHELHLFLRPARNAAYGEHIAALCAARDHVHQHPSIAPDDIARTINAFDIGVHHLHADTFNHRYALPNKLFEFVQARLAVVVTPNPAMAELVRKHDLGQVATGHSMEAVLEAIRALDAGRIMRHKAAANAAARELSAERGADLLREVVARLLGH